MDANEVDLICDALIDYKLIPRKRVTKKEIYTYGNMRKSLKNNKQNKTNIITQLLVCLIRDKTTLDPKLTQDHTEFFIKIMNSYPNRSVSEIVESEVHQRIMAGDSLKKAEKKRYDAEQELDRITKLKNQEIQEKLREKQELEKENARLEKTKTFYFNELSKYDSDISSEEEELHSINYEQEEVISTLRAKITEVSEKIAYRDEEIMYLKKKQILYDQMVEENESMKSETIPTPDSQTTILY